MTQAVSEIVETFNKRRLHNRYVCVYIDTTYIAVRRDTVSKEAVYIAVGIREDGSKEVLAYTIAPTKSTYNWQELLEELKERVVEDVLLFISDGLKGMADAVLTVFQKARYQVCFVHVGRNFEQIQLNTVVTIHFKRLKSHLHKNIDSPYTLSNMNAIYVNRLQVP